MLCVQFDKGEGKEEKDIVRGEERRGEERRGEEVRNSCQGIKDEVGGFRRREGDGEAGIEEVVAEYLGCCDGEGAIPGEVGSTWVRNGKRVRKLGPLEKNSRMAGPRSGGKIVLNLHCAI